MFTQDEAAKLIQKSIELATDAGGFIISKIMKSVNMRAMASIISDNVEIVGLRPGEN
jgi:FlaA1/EpsC-like NDP-sugar epimerase